MKPIQPEKKNEFLNVGLTPTLNEKINEFCKNNHVTRSVAARYILTGFFDGDFEISEPIPKNDGDFEKFGMTS